MDVSDIRSRNFKDLYAKFKQDHADLPDHGMIKAFAEHLGMSQAYLSHLHTLRKNIGARTARKIEAQLSLPAGYMDSLHTNKAFNASAAEKEYLHTALALYRASPVEAQAMMLKAVMNRATKKTSKSSR